jgi:hypothetical protein
MTVTPTEVCALLRGRAAAEVEVAPSSVAFPSPVESVLRTVPPVVVIVVRIEDQVTATGSEGDGHGQEGGECESGDEVMLSAHISNSVGRCTQSMYFPRLRHHPKVVSR